MHKAFHNLVFINNKFPIGAQATTILILLLEIKEFLTNETTPAFGSEQGRKEEEVREH